MGAASSRPHFDELHFRDFTPDSYLATGGQPRRPIPCNFCKSVKRKVNQFLHALRIDR